MAVVEPPQRQSATVMVAGGVAGGVAGFFAGALLGRAVDGDRCDGFCAGSGVVLGALGGEALGMSLGVHLAGGRKGSAPLGALTSAAILVGGVYAGSEKNGLLVITPLVQLAGTVLVERATSRQP